MNRNGRVNLKMCLQNTSIHLLVFDFFFTVFFGFFFLTDSGPSSVLFCAAMNFACWNLNCKDRIIDSD